MNEIFVKLGSPCPTPAIWQGYHYNCSISSLSEVSTYISLCRAAVANPVQSLYTGTVHSVRRGHVLLQTRIISYLGTPAVPPRRRLTGYEGWKICEENFNKSNLSLTFCLFRHHCPEAGYCAQT